MTFPNQFWERSDNQEINMFQICSNEMYLKLRHLKYKTFKLILLWFKGSLNKYASNVFAITYKI